MSLLRTLFKRRTRDGKTWGQLLSQLVEAFFALGKAEMLGIQAELRFGVAVFWKLLLMAATTAVLGGLAGGAILVAMMIGLSRVMPWWAACLLIGAVLGVAAVWTGLITRKLRRQLESPLRTVHRRLNEHLEWWREELLAGGSARVRPEPLPEELDDLRKVIEDSGGSDRLV